MFPIANDANVVLQPVWPDGRLIDTASGEILAVIPALSMGGKSFSSDGSLLASVTMVEDDCDLGGWDAATGEQLFDLASVCGSAIFSPDGLSLVVNDQLREIVLVYGIPNTDRAANTTVPAEVVPSGINIRSGPTYNAEIVGTASGWVTVGGVDPTGTYFYLTSHDAWALADPRYVNLREFSTVDQLRVIEN